MTDELLQDMLIMKMIKKSSVYSTELLTWLGNISIEYQLVFNFTFVLNINIELISKW